MSPTTSRFIRILAASLAVATIPAASAGSIGVNFSANTRPVLATDNPGIVAGDDWNNIAGASGTGIILQDDTATPTTATLTYTSTGTWSNFNQPNTDNAGTNTMYRGGIFGGSPTSEVSVTISNIPYPKYDLYVFASQDTTRTNQLSVTDGTTTYYYRGPGSNNANAPALTKTTSTTSGSPTVGRAQYQLFAERTASSVTLTTGGSFPSQLSNNLFGIHIVEIPADKPTLSDPAVGNITTTTADASATLADAAAEVTVFWAGSDYGTNLADWQTNGSADGPAARVVGPVTGALTGLAGDSAYVCRFYAVNTTPDPDLDDWSEPVSFATPLTGKSVSDLTATPYSSFEVDLAWTDNFNTETAFIIERSPAGANAWATVATLPAGTSFHTDKHTGLTPDTAYDYRVLATNANGDSDPSNVASATTAAATPMETQLLIHFDGSLDGTTYTLDAAEIDTTGSFQASGTPAVAGGMATVNPGRGGGKDGFFINPAPLDDLRIQNWVAEALLTIQATTTSIAESPTIIDVQGDCDFRLLHPNYKNLEAVYYNGTANSSRTTALPPLGSLVHVAMAWDAGTATLTSYVNGIPFGTASQGAFTAPDPSNLSFGFFGRIGYDRRGIDAVLDAVAFQTGTEIFDPATGFLILPAGTLYSSWIAGFPDVGAQNGFTADPDGDLLPNGLEAFFGTDPGTWNAGLTQLVTDGTTTTFTHPQLDPPLADLTGSYQWSLDLETWYAGDGIDGPPGGPTVTIPPVAPVDGTATVTATASEPIGRLFVRVAVTNE